MFAPLKSNIRLVCKKAGAMMPPRKKIIQLLENRALDISESGLACVAWHGAKLVLVALGEVGWRGEAHLISDFAHG